MLKDCLQVSLICTVANIQRASEIGDSLWPPKHLYCHPGHTTVLIDSHWIQHLVYKCKISPHFIQNQSLTPSFSFVFRMNILYLGLQVSIMLNPLGECFNMYRCMINGIGNVPLSFFSVKCLTDIAKAFKWLVIRMYISEMEVWVVPSFYQKCILSWLIIIIAAYERHNYSTCQLKCVILSDPFYKLISTHYCIKVCRNQKNLACKM